MNVKFKAGDRLVPGTMVEGDVIELTFRFNRTLIDEIKSFDGARWNPDRRLWTVKNTPRNKFQLSYLLGQNPYGPYDTPLKEIETSRPLYKHQVRLAAAGLTYKRQVFAAEMGVGKTLAAIEIMEASGSNDWWWIAPKSALRSVQLEFEKWKSKVIPKLLTYEGLVKECKTRTPQPFGVVFDECSRIKNPTAQRSIAAMALADAVRARDGYVILMSGTPSPKDPTDWWHICEVAQPGFLREGNQIKFKKRLAIIKDMQAIDGGNYPKLVAWRDSEDRCNECGKPKDDFDHGMDHEFVPGVNEIARLSKRMQGLVTVQFKRDCFSGDTEVITRQGVKTFRELANIGHAELYVYNGTGMEWRDCEIKNFGVQRTSRIRFGDGHQVRVTPGHQWLVRDRDGRVDLYKKKMTCELVEGKTELPYAPTNLPDIDWEGYAHGFVYGDGHLVQLADGPSTKVDLFGRDVDLLPLLGRYGNVGHHRQASGYYTPTVSCLPGSWKELPKNPSRSYALGFVLGLGVADGFIERHFQIYQANELALDEVRKLAVHAGLRVSNKIRMSREFSPFDGSRKPLYAITIQTYNLTANHFLRLDHKQKLIVRGRHQATTLSWVDRDSQTDEEVFCAIVPHYHNFTLANGLITGNCLELPEKQYEVIRLEPSKATLRAASLVEAGATSTIQALTLLRELSDGFQYQEEATGKTKCTNCHGTKEIPDYPTENLIPCPTCKATGEIDRMVRVAKFVGSPKLDAVADLLDQYSDVGRAVFYAGFAGSIDLLCDRVVKEGWEYIRADGRGWSSTFPATELEMLRMFQEGDLPKVAFIGQPGAAGMGLTLHRSPMCCFYSNDFNGESRWQAEDRIHRAGMDLNRSCMIYDLVHLDTDDYVRNNLMKKRNLMDISMGELRDSHQRAIA